MNYDVTIIDTSRHTFSNVQITKLILPIRFKIHTECLTFKSSLKFMLGLYEFHKVQIDNKR